MNDYSDMFYPWEMRPAKKVAQRTGWVAWVALILIALFIVAFLINHFTGLTTIEPETAHAAEPTVETIPFTDLEVYEYYEGETQKFCKKELGLTK